MFRWRAAEGWPVEYVSPNVKSQFGYDPASFAAAGLPFARLVHPDDLERVGREVRARTERRAESFEQLYRIEHADGGYRWVSDYTVVQRDDSGAVTYYLGYLLDVTDRLRTEAELRDAQAELAQRAEEALRRSEELYGSVLRAATGYSIIGTDVQGRVTVYNEGAELMLGYRADEVVGRELLSRFFDPEELASRAAEDGCEPDGVLFGAARRGQTDSREWTLVRKDGSRLKASITTTAIRESGGSVRGFIGIARDVTGEREMELKLIQSQKMETVGLLAGGVAHDFNNLLTPILGYSEMLLADLSADDPRRSPLQEVKQAAERAKDLTQRLLSFSRKQLIELKPLDLADAIRRFQPILRRTISESIRIDLFLPPSPRLVRADAAQIDQILLNLSINAQDAMPSGGVLRIEVTDSPTAAGSPSAASAPVVMLQVSDTGVGMDARTMEHAFEPFYTTKELGKGTGLGLSTVYGIVKQHGGSVDVTSTVGRGTTFRILLPRLDGAEAPVVPLEEPPPRALRDGGTVLVVEDNAAVRALTCHMLEKLGYRTFSAASPEHCREITRTYDGPIDLLLTDMVMPAMNGKALYELLRSIRPELKVLFMSGYSGSIIGRDGVLEGEAPFIHKPFSFDALARKVREALGP